MKRDTILIFEDNSIDREILVELFRSEYKILEAAVRSMVGQGKSLDDVEEFIKTLIKDKLDDGQLDKSGLAISDLETIRKSFIEVFKGMYHNRVAYPKKEEMDAAKKQKKGEQEENKT